MSAPALSRRSFLQVGATAAGGLVLGVYLPGCDARGRGTAAAPAGPPLAPSIFLRIDPDDTVTIAVPRPEMGQGVRTGLPLIVAAELDADWSRVKIEQADLDERYGDQYSGGSNSTQHSWLPLRRAGGVARAMLLAAAAKQWNVPVESCRTSAGRVHHDASGRNATYGHLVAIARTLPAPKAESVELRPVAGLPLVGRRIRQLDSEAIVTGAMRYGFDTRVPGMLFASIERSPTFDARPYAVDDAAARAQPGVRSVVTVDADALPDFADNGPKPANGVAVVADSTWSAMRGRRALRVTWEPTEAARESTAAVHDLAVKLSATKPERVVRADGDVDAALARCAHRIEAVYEQPLLAHAQMEPMSCTASFLGDRCEVWAPTQDPAGARDVVHRITGLPPAAVAIHPVRMGGAFGRRFYHDFVAEAVLVSRAVKAPVQVAWTREDDMRHGFYRPGAYHVIRGGVDAAGLPIAWEQFLINASRGEFLHWMTPFPAGADLGKYDFPAGVIADLRLEASKISTRIPRGQWRAVEESVNVFVGQCFFDELAHLGGRDPLELRLTMLEPERTMPYDDDPTYTWNTARLARVLRVAADAAGWGKPLPPRHGRGIAGCYANEAYAAMVADVEVSAAGELRVHRVVAAADCGLVVNPVGLEAQVEGSVVFGLAAALHQEITVADGAVVQGSFDDFPLLRIDEAPRIEVHLVPGEGPPLGAGEMALPPVAPAIANAIFAATGKRLRRLPLSRAELAS